MSAVTENQSRGGNLPEKSHEPPRILPKPRGKKRQATKPQTQSTPQRETAKPTPQRTAPGQASQREGPQPAPQLEVTQSTAQVGLPQPTPQREAVKSTTQLEVSQPTPQVAVLRPTPQIEAPQSTNKQGVESTSDEDEPGNHRDERRLTGFNANNILVSGLCSETTRDSLVNYMELMSDEDVKGLKFLGNGRALVETEEPVGTF